MKRFKALLRETWWLWLLILVGGCIFGFAVSRVFFISIPICVFSFIYFGLMRYDADGNPIGDGAD